MRSSGGLWAIFHGDNTGSNPVGDSNKTNNLFVKSAAKAPFGDSVVTKRSPLGRSSALAHPCVCQREIALGLQKRWYIVCNSTELNSRGALKALRATWEGDKMKTATLIVLICSGLNLLGFVLYACMVLFHIPLQFTHHGLGLPILNILLVASLFNYFLALYKSQKS
jgi:hypothetical protein